MPFPPPPPPPRFFPVLLLWHAFPLHSPLTLWVLDAPFGRFQKGVSRFNVNANVAWFFMEITAPITLLWNLSTPETPALNPSAKVLAGMYITHYVHRAILSPLVLSPRRTDLNIAVPLAAFCWNLANATLISLGLAYFPPTLSVDSPAFIAGVVGWAIGFLGNGLMRVYHDEILNDIRRPPGKRLLPHGDLKEEAKDKKVTGGRYAIPRGAMFELVAFPNYTCEWFEWICFALIAGPVTIPVPPRSTIAAVPWVHRILSALPFWPARLLSPGWMFVVCEITSMLPRAIRSQRWYERTFGKRYPKDRKIVIPGIY